MKYIYQIKNKKVKESNDKNDISNVWSLSDLIKQEPNSVSILVNTVLKYIEDENQVSSSYIRTKNWIKENYPELLI
jgi:hypothetical protein